MKKILSAIIVVGVAGILCFQLPTAVVARKSPKSSPSPTPTVLRNEVIKGVNYNPTSIGTNVLDAFAANIDVAKIADLGANTIGTYNAGLFEWGSLSDVNVNVGFYDALANQADAFGLKMIVGYFANQTMDWTNASRRAKVASQYQQLVAKSSSHLSTYMMLVGNELFEKLPDDASRLEYAKWVGEMADWTHNNYPGIKVTYADNHALTGLYWLKQNAPNLDVYSVNSYEWTNVDELTAIVDRFSALWPDKPLLLHEWGVDSYDGIRKSEDWSAQGNRITTLATVIDSVAAIRPQLLGSVYFEYTDQWDKAGSGDTQDPIATNWRCMTCFDQIAHEDYWGLVTNVYPGQVINRKYKTAYSSLQAVWKN